MQRISLLEEEKSFRSNENNASSDRSGHDTSRSVSHVNHYTHFKPVLSPIHIEYVVI